MEIDGEGDSLKARFSTGDASMSEAEDGELIEDNLDLLDEAEEQNKLTQRAKRFGISPTEINSLASSNKKIKRLYNRMGVDSKMRLEALHLFGTDNMKTQDVFAYFEGHTPASVEWLTDKTCNVVWLDEKSCAEALLACSLPIQGHSMEYSSQCDTPDSSDEECIKVEDLRLALPPGIWRKGHSRSLAPNLFLRFATRFDRRDFRRDGFNPVPPEFAMRARMFPDEGDERTRKLRVESGNPWSDIARQWGQFEKKSSKPRDARDIIKNREVRETVNMPRDAREIINSEKDYYEEKQVQEEEDDDEEEEEEEKEEKNGKKVFGRMHADIEERKILKRKKIYASRVAEEVDLRSRLGRKRRRPDNERRWSTSSEEADLRIEIDNNVKSRLGEVIWTGYNSGESSVDSDEVELRPSTEDLRKKLKKSSQPFTAHSPLRIEIDNDIYYAGISNESS